jgi:hypothetical protein
MKAHTIVLFSESGVQQYKYVPELYDVRYLLWYFDTLLSDIGSLIGENPTIHNPLTIIINCISTMNFASDALRQYISERDRDTLMHEAKVTSSKLKPYIMMSNSVNNLVSVAAGKVPIEPSPLSSSSDVNFLDTSSFQYFDGVDILTFVKENNTTLNFPQKVCAVFDLYADKKMYIDLKTEKCLIDLL